VFIGDKAAQERLSFPFTYFATQNARKVRGRRKVIKKLSIDDK
jgi:hypothetical protein